jgi:hypothetical protein
VAVFLLTMWLLHARAHESPVRRFAAPVVVLLVLASSLSAWPVLVVGLLMAGLVVVKVSVGLKREAGGN